MLRESLFKRFGKRKYGEGGTNDANPAPLILPGNEMLNTSKDDPRKLEFSPEAQKRQDASWGSTSPEPNIQRPKSIYDSDMYKVADYNMPTEEQKFSKEDELTKEQDTVSSEPTSWDKTKDYLKDNWQALGINALAGVSGVLNYNDDIRKTDQLNQDIQQRGTKPLEDYNYMYGRTTSGGTRNQGIIMAKQGAQIQSRYNTPTNVTNNVEIEGGEYIILPDGTTEVAKGPSHSQSYKADNESYSGINTTLPENTMVFSNSMKPADFKKMPTEEKMAKVGAYLEKGGQMNDLDFSTMFKYGGKKDQNKTFAQLAKRYDTTYEEKILNNPFSKPEDRQAALLNRQKKEAVKAQLFRDQQFMNGQSNGEPQMSRGGINNPGFNALPGYVQEKIKSNMEDGGTYKYTKDGKEYDTKVPKNKIKAKGEAKVGDYYEENGVLKKVSAQRSGLPGYQGKDIGSTFAGNQQIADQYAYLEQQFSDPATRKALAEKIRGAAKNKDYYKGKSGRTSSAYGQLGNVDEMSDQQLTDAFLRMNKRNLALQANGYDVKALQDAPDKGGRTNAAIREASKKVGIPLTEDFANIGLEQAGYLGYRDLLKDRDAGKLDPAVAGNVKAFSIGQRGATDEMTSIDPEGDITPIDAVYTNTSAGQYGASNVDPIYDAEDVPGTFQETPEGEEFSIETPPRGEYKRMPYDPMQAVPAAYALAQAQETFPYAIPEVDAPYIKPQTLSVDAQLQSQRNLGISALRAGADPNMVFAMTADNEGKAFQEKRNWDAQAQERADQTNFNAELQTRGTNAQLFNQAYNDMYATAKGNQSVAKQNALTALVTNRAKYNQDENLKEFYYNNLVPSYNFDPNKPGFKMIPTRDPKTGVVTYRPAQGVSSTTESYTPSTAKSTTTTPAGATTTSTYTPPSSTASSTTTPTTAAGATSPSSSTTTPAVKGNGYQLPANAPEMTANDVEPAFNLASQKTNLNPNLPLSMQYGPKTKDNTPIDYSKLPTSMGGLAAEDEMTKGATPLGMRKGGKKMATGYYEEGGVVYEFMFNFDPKSIQTPGKTKRK